MASFDDDVAIAGSGLGASVAASPPSSFITCRTRVAVPACRASSAKRAPTNSEQLLYITRTHEECERDRKRIHIMPGSVTITSGTWASPRSRTSPLGPGYERIDPIMPHRPVVPAGAPGELRLDAKEAYVIPDYPC